MSELATTASSNVTYTPAGGTATSYTPTPAAPPVYTSANGLLDPVLYGQTTSNTGGRTVPTGISKTAPTTVVPKAKTGGKLGLILNTGAALLTLGGFAFSQDDLLSLSPTAPQPPQTDVAPRPGFTTPWGPYAYTTQGQHSLVSVAGTFPTYLQPTTAWPVGGYTLTVVMAFQNLTANQISSVPAPWFRTVCRRTSDNTESFDPTTGNGGASPVVPAYSSAQRTFTVALGCPSGYTEFVRWEIDVPGPSEVSPRPGDIKYFPETHPDRPSDSVETTPSTVKTTVECRAANGAVTLVEQVAEIVMGPGMEWTPPSATCPAGQVAQSGTVTTTHADNTTVDLIPKVNAAPEVLTNPSCWDGSCRPQLEVDTSVSTDTGPKWRPCESSQHWTSCVGFMRDPKVNPETDLDNKFRCVLNGVVIHISRCTQYRVNPDNGDPEVVYPIPPSPPENDDSGSDVDENCFSGAVSWNPINWVYIPVKCVLQWAFVPSDDALNAWHEDAQTIMSRPPLVYASAGLALGEDVKAASSCLSDSSCPEADDMMVVQQNGEALFSWSPLADANAFVAEHPQVFGPIRTLIIFAGWMGFAYWSVLRISRSFGGKE